MENEKCFVPDCPNKAFAVFQREDKYLKLCREHSIKEVESYRKWKNAQTHEMRQSTKRSS
jgi:ribosomal protein L44E